MWVPTEGRAARVQAVRATDDVLELECELPKKGLEFEQLMLPGKGQRMRYILTMTPSVPTYSSP